MEKVKQMSGILFESPRWQDPDGLIRECAVAKRWGKSIRTLQRWRASGYGPAYISIGGSIRYRMRDVLAFESSLRRGGEGEQ